MSDVMKEQQWTDPVALAAAADRIRDLVTGGGWVDVANTPEDAIWDLLLIARDWIHSHTPTPDGPPAAAPERWDDGLARGILAVVGLAHVRSGSGPVMVRELPTLVPEADVIRAAEFLRGAARAALGAGPEGGT